MLDLRFGSASVAFLLDLATIHQVERLRAIRDRIRTAESLDEIRAMIVEPPHDTRDMVGLSHVWPCPCRIQL